MTKEQLHRAKEQLRSLSPLPERERDLAAYGQLYGDILNELLGLVLLQQRERLSDVEVRVFAKSIFEDYIADHLPQIAKQAARYQEARRAEELEQAARSAQHAEQRQARQKAEQEAREKAAADAEAARYRKAKANEAALLEELSKIRAQEQRDLQERM